MQSQFASRPYTAWQLLKAYWQSHQRIFAYIALLTVLAFTLAMVGFSVLFNHWYNHFYDALQEYDRHSVLDLLVVFCFLAAISIILSVYRYYMQQILTLRWRRWLTDQFILRWLQHKSYFYLESFDKNTDNPDQRIQEDVAALVSQSLGLLVGLLSSIATFIAFVFILWNLSGTLNIPLGKFGMWHIPGYLLWVSIMYALIGTIITFRLGRPLVSLNFEQQRREADLRYAAVDLRTHAEYVALYRGEKSQHTKLQYFLQRALDNTYLIIIRQKILLWFTAGYNQVAVLVPLLVALPNYFAKVFKLGGLIQTINAFGAIQDALSFIINSFAAIAEWRAVTARLLTFLNRLTMLEEKMAQYSQLIRHFHPEKNIKLHNVTLSTPLGEELLINLQHEFIHGQHYLLQGMSGIGKSTLIRAIAGIWPYGSGEIYLPEQNIMYIPQKTYMPLGSLRENLLFSHAGNHMSDETLAEILGACHLNHLIPRLNEVSQWAQHLSLGEMQRIAFARILIQKPDWVFLDESTSALDLQLEQQLYQLLKQRLPYCSLISIGHRSSLIAWHDHIYDLNSSVTRAAVA